MGKRLDRRRLVTRIDLPRRQVFQAAMRAFGVIVVHELGDQVAEMVFAENQESAETLLFYYSDKSLRDSVYPRCQLHPIVTKGAEYSG